MEDDQSGAIDKINDLEAQLAGIGSSDEEDDLTNDLEDTIKQIEQQLGPQLDEQVVPLPGIGQITTVLSIDGYLKQTGKQQTKEFYLTLLSRKQKLIKAIKDGNLTAETYKNSLQKKKVQPNNHVKIAKYVEEQLSMIPYFGSVQQWFNELVKKSNKLLNAQLAVFPQTKNQIQQTHHAQQTKTGVAQKQKLEAVKNQQPPKHSQQALSRPVASNPHSVTQLNPAAKLTQQQALIVKLDQATPHKKAEMVLKSLAKIESLVLYYKQNLSDRKAKEVNEQLIPNRDIGLKVVNALLTGKDMPIADLVLNKLPKVDFERFHGCSRKQYHAKVEAICRKYKELERDENNFKKKIGRSNENSDISIRTNQMTKAYKEDLEYLNSIKTKDFVPLPTVSVAAEERENFVENTKLQKNDLQIQITKVEGINGHAQLKIYFEQSNNPRTVFQINEGACKIDFMLKITQQAVKQITTKMIKIKIEGKKMLLFNSVLAYMEIPLTNFSNQNSIDGVAESSGVKVTYQFNMRTPQKRVTKTKIEIITIKKYPEYVYAPEFQADFLKKFINYSTNAKQIEKAHQSQQPQLQPQQLQQSQNQKQTAIAPLFYAERTDTTMRQMVSLAIPGFLPDNIIRPEIYSDCLSYLIKMDEVLDKAINKTYTAKVNKQLLDELQDQIIKRKTMVETAKQQGKLPNEIYAAKLQSNIRNDQVLMGIFKAQGIHNMAEFLMVRIQMAIQELNMLMPQQANLQKKPSQVPQQQISQQQISQRQIPQQQLEKSPELQKQSQATTVQQSNQASLVKQLDLTPYPLFFVVRTEQTKQALNSITGPIDYVDANKIKNPETQCLSVKYLLDFEKVLDKAMSELAGDKVHRNMAEQLQDAIQKKGMLMKKKQSSMKPEQYRMLVVNDIEKDQKLFEIYKKLNIQQMQQFILGRIRVMKLEIGQKPVLTIIKNTFDLNEERELSDIQRTPQSNQTLEKFGPELKQPELPQFCTCVTYLEKMIEVSKSPELVKEFHAAKDRFEALIGNGEMDEQKYAAILKKNRDEDMARLDVYKKLNLKEFYLFIKARLKIIESELANL